MWGRHLEWKMQRHGVATLFEKMAEAPGAGGVWGLTAGGLVMHSVVDS